MREAPDTRADDAGIYDVESLDEAPATLAEALGRPLDEAEILAEPVATVAAAPASEVAGPTTASGYKKRVRGANTPNTDVLSARGDDTTDADAADGAQSTSSALSGLQAGMQRGRSESTDG